jgi:CheY-like chemotaxis protein
MAMAARLLLAEDSLTIQKVFELTFKQSGIALTMVDNGVDAVRLANEISPDIVVADVSLPGKDGFQVATELRSTETAAPCPVLILAGTLAPFDEERFKRCGANGVLFKPFESQELIDKVDSILRTAKEPAPAPEEREQAPPPAEEPWDFSDVLIEAEAGAPASRTAGADDLAGVAMASAGTGESSVSLGDFDVSLEDIEGQPEPKEAAPEFASSEQAEPGGFAPPVELMEESVETVSHLEPPAFDDSPPAVTDLTPAFEMIEELEEIDFLETIESPEEGGAGPAPVTAGVMPAAAHVSPAAEPFPREQELRELFSARAQEIFEKVAAETVEKVMWEVVEKLTKEFTEKIRESVETVAWEVIPATTEALIREEIARIREQAGKESS